MRKTKWKDYDHNEKKWFIISCIHLFVVLLAVVIDGAEVLIIPDWLQAIIGLSMLYPLGKIIHLYEDI